MRAFARDWLGKNHYKDGKQITKEEVRRFSGYTVEKSGSNSPNERDPREALSDRMRCIEAFHP